MAWNDLKAAIAAVIKTNGTQAITGALLQSTLNSIVDNVGQNAAFKGLAIPSTTPGTPDGPQFYLAAKQGVYSNFGGLSLTGQPAILNWNGSNWSVSYIGSMSFTHSANISNDLSKLQSILSTTVSRFGQDILTESTRIVSIDGTSVPAAYVKSSDFINLQNATSVAITLPVSAVDAGLAFYDTNKAYISGVLRSGVTGYSFEEIQVPVGAKYLRTCYWYGPYIIDNIPFSLKLMGISDRGNNLLKTQFRLITGSSPAGSVRVLENGTIEFSAIYLVDSESGKRIYLTDGTHAYNETNSITPTLYDSLYINLSDFVSTAANGSLAISKKIWTELTTGNISLGIFMSLTNKGYQYGEIFSIADKQRLNDIESQVSNLELVTTLDNLIPDDSFLDENTEVVGDDSAGIWQIRFPSNANNYVQKLTDEAEDYFKVSLDTVAGGNPAFWSLNDMPTWIRGSVSHLKFSIKADEFGTLKLNTDSEGFSTYSIPLTTDWVDIDMDVIFGSTYGDMRLMFYIHTGAKIFYIKNITLTPTAVSKKISALSTDVDSLKSVVKVNWINTEKLPTVLSKFGDILFESSGVLNIGLFGDSWTHGVGSTSTGLITYAKYLARIMWEKYGYAGLGWFDFGYSNPTDMKCADDEAVTYTKSGSLTYIAKTSGSLGITIAHTEMTIGAFYNLAFDQGRAVDKAKIWFYNDAHFEYQIDGGAAVEVTADSISGWQSVEISSAISTLRITALSDNTIVFGVDLSYGTTGVKIHKLGCRGLTTAQSIAVDETNWKQGIQALDLDFFSTLLFTNDRSRGVTPETVVTNTNELLNRVKEAYTDIIDVAIICPSESQGGSGTYSIDQYTDALRESATSSGTPFLSLKPIFGTPEQIIALGTFYDYLHPSKKGDYLISEFLFKHLFEYHQY